MKQEIKPHKMICAALLLAATCALGQVQGGDFSRPFVWTHQAFELPSSIQVAEGEASAADGSPIRAWIADIDYADKTLVARAFLSQSEKGKEPVSVQTGRVGAYVAINGGYFDVNSVPAKTFSLVRRDGQTYAENIGRVSRPGRIYFVTRSALGMKADRTFDFAWIHHIGDAIYAYPQPSPNTTQTPAPEVTADYPTGAKLWDVPDGIGAGPRLVQDGKINVSYEPEVFFGSGFGRDNPYARAAVGVTAANHLILFVTDGSQPTHSVGLTLPQLAQEMLNLGCVQAMNLDGGGSETLVVNGVAVNKPAAGAERDVTSILAIVPAP